MSRASTTTQSSRDQSTNLTARTCMVAAEKRMWRGPTPTGQSKRTLPTKAEASMANLSQETQEPLLTKIGLMPPSSATPVIRMTIGIREAAFMLTKTPIATRTWGRKEIRKEATEPCKAFSTVLKIILVRITQAAASNRKSITHWLATHS